MLRVIGKRLALLVPTLIGLSILLFLWVRNLPGGPATALLGERATPEAVERVNELYGFNEPIISQYFTYMGKLLQGDFGTSINTGRPVLEEFATRFPGTVELTIVALIFAIGIGIPLGYVAARYYGRFVDHGSVVLSLLGITVPVFFLAFILKYLFAIQWPILPPDGRQDPRMDATHVTDFYVLDGILTGEWDAAWDAFQHLILPGIALGTIPLAIIVRITRASVLEVQNADYVRTARAKGLMEKTIRNRFILRNAMLPVVTTIGLQVGLLISGAVLTETVFAFNGIGRFLRDAIFGLDYPVLQGFIIIIAILYAVINLIVDISYSIIDPRVRVS
ncbi:MULTISPECIES: ABC transporter permease [unclassified Arthrobacter]|uniref:ABC transporter permease n=1 Tax=unclassified Arthrobacter TaxID=235627 RepID=UPI001490A386|nr:MULTISPECIES: ABC transporter permease [unclassified Arthrobacter]MBE0011388.1 ABC transporter permease [Arthrobacter sp. AET 35A]MBP2215464.1 peptide/nickel transport system permease protein [Arthrobacter sp. CAN_C5]NOJ60141.1 ABC transporter permease [Arthrobacter sp. 260]